MNKPSFPPPAPICVPCRLAAIGAVVVALAGGFAYVAGWLTPQRLTTHRIINAFEADGGAASGLPPQPCKGRVRSRLFRQQRQRRGALECGSVCAGAHAGHRPFCDSGRQSVRARHQLPIRSLALLFNCRMASNGAPA